MPTAMAIDDKMQLLFLSLTMAANCSTMNSQQSRQWQRQQRWQRQQTNSNNKPTAIATVITWKPQPQRQALMVNHNNQNILELGSLSVCVCVDDAPFLLINFVYAILAIHGLVRCVRWPFKTLCRVIFFFSFFF